MNLAMIASIGIPLVVFALVVRRPAHSGFARGVRIAFGALVLATIPVQLFVLHGLRIELQGTGYTPMFSFDSDERRFARLEAHRGRQEPSTANLDPGARAPADESSGSGAEDSAIEPEPPEDHTPDETILGPGGADSPTPNTSPPSGSEDAIWPRFRGPQWDGHYRADGLNLDWSTSPPRQLWRQPIGGGYASFVFARMAQGLWAFTIEQRRDREAVAAYDVMTGREIWVHDWEADFRESMGGNGPRATPTFDDGRLYALGAFGTLRSLDAAEGTLLWSVDLLADNASKNLQWAFAWSPLVVDNLLITLPGGRGRSVVAYDKKTGRRVWSSLDDTQAYTSPMLVDIHGRRQILSVSGERILGLSPTDGSVLWEWPWVTQAGVNASQPLVIHDPSGSERVFLSAGYGHGAMMLDISLEDEQLVPNLLWENGNMKNKFSSSVLHNGFIYGLDERILACIDANTGKRQWKGGRYGHGQLLLAEGHLVVTTETGELVLVEATSERHREIARLPAVSGKTWNYPAVSDGVLLVRNASEMVAFDLNR